jgi:hypothetical protein
MMGEEKAVNVLVLMGDGPIAKVALRAVKDAEKRLPTFIGGTIQSRYTLKEDALLRAVARFAQVPGGHIAEAETGSVDRVAYEGAKLIDAVVELIEARARLVREQVDAGPGG